MVVLIALAGARSLRRPLEDLSRAADDLQVERLPAALHEIEAGRDPAPRPPISAPAELESVAGALENLERFVHYHAKRAQRADRDLGTFITGAADRAGERAHIAEGIDLGPSGVLASGLHRDAAALRALLPDESPAPAAAAESSVVHGSSITATVAAAAQTTLRPPAIVLGDFENAIVDSGITGAITIVLGEVLDSAIGADGAVVVHGSVQPEGYHVVIDATIGSRGAELMEIAEALRTREPDWLPFGLRAGMNAGRRARLLVWLTLGDTTAQWHVLLPPHVFQADAVPESPVVEGPLPPVAEPVVVLDEPDVPEEMDVPAPSAMLATNGSTNPAELERLAEARRLADDLTAFVARLEWALEGRRERGDAPIGEPERTALVVDGTLLVGRMQEAELGSAGAQRALLRALDAVGGDRPASLAEIRAVIAEAASGLPTGSVS
jgi:hypothetical protein